MFLASLASAAQDTHRGLDVQRPKVPSRAYISLHGSVWDPFFPASSSDSRQAGSVNSTR